MLEILTLKQININPQKFLCKVKKVVPVFLPFLSVWKVQSWNENIMLHILNTYLSLRDNKLDNFFVRTTVCMSKGSTTLKCNLREKKCHHLKSLKPSFFKSSKETQDTFKKFKIIFLKELQHNISDFRIFTSWNMNIKKLLDIMFKILSKNNLEFVLSCFVLD